MAKKPKVKVISRRLIGPADARLPKVEDPAAPANVGRLRSMPEKKRFCDLCKCVAPVDCKACNGVGFKCWPKGEECIA